MALFSRWLCQWQSPACWVVVLDIMTAHGAVISLNQIWANWITQTVNFYYQGRICRINMPPYHFLPPIKIMNSDAPGRYKSLILLTKYTLAHTHTHTQTHRQTHTLAHTHTHIVWVKALVFYSFLFIYLFFSFHVLIPTKHYIGE